MEETFLDEGLAHLSECLNGYGVSGGDILFAKRYLDSPEVFSFSGGGTDSSQDSIGRRGAMLLLLSWIFWREGGLAVTADGVLVDNGGLALLHALIDDGRTGWDSLAAAKRPRWNESS